MITLNISYDVLPDRIVTIKLPETVRLGRHDLKIMVEENYSENQDETLNAKRLAQFAGSITAFNEVDGVEYQKKMRSEWN